MGQVGAEKINKLKRKGQNYKEMVRAILYLAAGSWVKTNHRFPKPSYSQLGLAQPAVTFHSGICINVDNSGFCGCLVLTRQ